MTVSYPTFRAAPVSIIDLTNKVVLPRCASGSHYNCTEIIQRLLQMPWSQPAGRLVTCDIGAQTGESRASVTVTRRTGRIYTVLAIPRRRPVKAHNMGIQSSAVLK